MAKKTVKIEKGVPENVTRPVVPYLFTGTVTRRPVVIHAESSEEAKAEFEKKYSEKKISNPKK